METKTMKYLPILTLLFIVACGKTTTEGCTKTYDGYTQAWSCTTSTTRGNVTDPRDEKTPTCDKYIKMGNSLYTDCLDGMNNAKHVSEVNHAQQR